MNIFVSYTRINDEVTLKSLLEFSKIARLFGNVFIDILDNNSIDKQERVLTELENSDLLILIKSNSSFNSRWVNFELNTARRLNIPIFEISKSNIDKLSINDLYEIVILKHTKSKVSATNIWFCDELNLNK